MRNVAGQEAQPFVGETDDLTIEHLLPQASKKVGHSDQIIGKIGNLVLVDARTNALLSNNDFRSKKKVLEDRGYKLPQMLIDAGEITPDIISQNTLRIAEIARSKIWKV